EVVAVDAGDDDVGEPERRDGLGEVLGLLRIGGQRPAVGDVAERAAPRAQVAEDHEGRRAFAEALADVGTGGFLAHRVQILLAQDPLDLVEARALGRGPHADPLGLAQALDRRDRDRDARLGETLLLFRDFAHRDSSSRAMCAASALPMSSAFPAIPSAEVWVTWRPGYPQGSMFAKGERSMSTLSATPW